jgi:hypothetical protein
MILIILLLIFYKELPKGRSKIISNLEQKGEITELVKPLRQSKERHHQNGHDVTLIT